jgi:DNA replication and repair protein RecF
LHCWHEYYRILKQRNQLLKNQDKSGLDIWTEKLAEAGAEVIHRRQLFVSVLSGLLQRHYATISGGSETAGIHYQPDGVTTTNVPDIMAELQKLFEKHGHTDERYCTTTAGPHRDDIRFSLDGKSLKTLGSQGQQKSFVLALKMAEIDNLHGIYGEPPLLLLDDISSELDARRNKNLTDFLISKDIQVFITTTERSPALLRAAAHCAVFRVEGGNLTFEGNEPHE